MKYGCLVDAVRTMGVNTRAVGTLSRYSDGVGMDALGQLGMRGTRVVMQDRDFFQALEDTEQLHAALPPQWHIELTGSWLWLAGLAPRLSRLSWTFVAVCPDMWHQSFTRADTARFVWWMEMGNVYLKLLSQEPLRCQRALSMVQPLLAPALAGVDDRLPWGSDGLNQVIPPLRASENFKPAGRSGCQPIPLISTPKLFMASAIDAIYDVACRGPVTSGCSHQGKPVCPSR